MEIIFNVAKEGMEKAIKSFERDLGTVSTGRANAKLLDPVRVEAYGNFVPLNQISNVSVVDAVTISIQAWDKSMINPIDRAISMANLGFTPKVDGNVIRVSIPKLTEERRKELCKLVKKYSEERKINVRNVRRDALDMLKRQKDDFSENDRKKFEERIQKLTDEYIEKVESLLNEKENDILKQ